MLEVWRQEKPSGRPAAKSTLEIEIDTLGIDQLSAWLAEKVIGWHQPGSPETSSSASAGAPSGSDRKTAGGTIPRAAGQNPTRLHTSGISGRWCKASCTETTGGRPSVCCRSSTDEICPA